MSQPQLLHKIRPKLIAQLNGYIVLIVDALDKDPGSGELFIFRNRAGDKPKMVYCQKKTLNLGLSF